MEGCSVILSSLLDIESVVERAQFLRHENPRECVAVYSQILDYPNVNDTVIKIKEACTLELAEVFGELKDIASLSALLESSRNFFTVLSKAKAAKIGLLLFSVIPT